jgi:hypothetical protein
MADQLLSLIGNMSPEEAAQFRETLFQADRAIKDKVKHYNAPTYTVKEKLNALITHVNNLLEEDPEDMNAHRMKTQISNWEKQLASVYGNSNANSLLNHQLKITAQRNALMDFNHLSKLQLALNNINLQATSLEPINLDPIFIALIGEEACVGNNDEVKAASLYQFQELITAVEESAKALRSIQKRFGDFVDKVNTRSQLEKVVDEAWIEANRPKPHRRENTNKQRISYQQTKTADAQPPTKRVKATFMDTNLDHNVAPIDKYVNVQLGSVLSPTHKLNEAFAKQKLLRHHDSDDSDDDETQHLLSL